MIEVIISDEDGELGRITLERLTDHADSSSDYSVRFAVERIGAVGLHQRSLYNFPRLRYNVLALLLQALQTLDKNELELEDGISASDMARRQHRTLPALQAWKSRLRHN